MQITLIYVIIASVSAGNFHVAPLAYSAFPAAYSAYPAYSLPAPYSALPLKTIAPVGPAVLPAAPLVRAAFPAAPAVAASPLVRAGPLPVVPAAPVIKAAPIAAAPVAAAPLAAAPVAAAKLEYADAYPQYQYAYNIQDTLTGDSKAQEEIREGGVVKGRYSLIEADGSRRTVNYYADPLNGFNAVVQKDLPVVAASPVVKAAPAIVSV